jgi:hypothetical protein
MTPREIVITHRIFIGRRYNNCSFFFTKSESRTSLTGMTSCWEYQMITLLFLIGMMISVLASNVVDVKFPTTKFFPIWGLSQSSLNYISAWWGFRTSSLQQGIGRRYNNFSFFFYEKWVKDIPDWDDLLLGGLHLQILSVSNKLINEFVCIQ